MLSFKQYLHEEYQELIERLIILGNSQYPRFGNVVIMAGGAGSGKGFVKDKLLGVEGFSFDVDELKKISSKTPMIVKKVQDELGVDLMKLSSDLKSPENVSKLHEIIGDYLSLDDKKVAALYKSIMASSPDRKPNLIFDVTLKDLRKLEKITRQVKSLGYDLKKIHIIWVINDIEIAKKQNLSRNRAVPDEILINTHRGVSSTMYDILGMGKSLSKYMDGDIVFAFNKIKVDSSLIQARDGDEDATTSKDIKIGPAKAGRKIGFGSKITKGGSYVEDANYFYVKKSGQTVKSVGELSKDIRSKIQSYVPRSIDWDF